MAEFPTYEEMAKNVAEKALDDFLYNGKSIREWMQIIASEDCISRQATVERLCKVADFMNEKRSGLGSPYIMAALFIQDNKDEFPSVTPKPKTDVLEKIRAEIKEVQTYKMFEGEDTVYVERKDVLAIIDKYTAEKEK